MKYLFCLILFVTGWSASAQESNVTATNPASLKWFQINTPNFRLLYPQGFEVQAQRMANTFEAIREPEAHTIGTTPKRISLVLQNQSSISNAFVSIAPRRAEFYTMPSQNYNFLGTNDWLNLLASHEYRHMAQFQHATRGFSKVAKYAFGNNVLAAMSYVAVPQWFWEGDAVATETAFTKSGRGRIPYFDLVLRTNLQEGRVFNYNKQYLRSYKNNINDHYVLGYHMVSYLRKRTNDPQIWDKVTARAWNWPILFPFRFSLWALKKESGLTVRQLYKEMAKDLQKDWKAQQDSLQLTSFETVNKRNSKTYTDYLYPKEMEDGSIVVRRSGIGDIEQLVLLKDGDERKIFTQGIINESGMQSAANKRIVWNEFRFDPRWQVRTYSTIVGYDDGSKQRQVISSKQRYAGAALSPDGYKVATVESTTDYLTKLIVLDYFSGRILRTFENPDNDFISMPCWTADGKEIVALLTNKRGKAIARFNFETGVFARLTEFSDENIGYPVPVGNYILYNSPVSGIDNIYAIDLSSAQRFQITCSKYGAFNPSISRDGKSIYYNDQSRNGMDVVKIPFHPPTWKLWTQKVQAKSDFDLLAKQEGSPSIFSNIPEKQYESKRYYRWKGIINPYSWGGTVSTSLTSAFVGVTSQDLLSTTIINAGYAYDITEKTGAWKAAVSFQGWYPIIDFSVSQSDRKVNEGNITTSVVNANTNDTTYLAPRNLTFKWKEKNIEGGLRLPLNTTTSKYFGNVTVGNAIGMTQVNGFNSAYGSTRYIPGEIYIKGTDTSAYVYPFINYQGNGNLIYNHFSLSAYRLLKQSRRDINSKWGQAFFMDAYGTPYGGNYNGSQFSLYGIGYFPGLFKHHSLWGYWGYQYTKLASLSSDVNNYTFRNNVPLPRGSLGVIRFQNFYTMSANYTLPVWYPDIALGPVLNIQRVRLNGFYDYGFGNGRFGSTYSQTYSSTGVEVKFDINVMRFLPQLDIGLRYSKGLNPSSTLVEVLVGMINF